MYVLYVNAVGTLRNKKIHWIRSAKIQTWKTTYDGYGDKIRSNRTCALLYCTLVVYLRTCNTVGSPIDKKYHISYPVKRKLLLSPRTQQQQQQATTINQVKTSQAKEQPSAAHTMTTPSSSTTATSTTTPYIPSRSDTCDFDPTVLGLPAHWRLTQFSQLKG